MRSFHALAAVFHNQIDVDVDEEGEDGEQADGMAADRARGPRASCWPDASR